MTTFRRTLLAFGATLVMTASGVAARAAGDGAADFVRSLGGQLVAVVNAPGSPASKRSALQPIIDDNIAVDDIALFCLGRFSRSASPAQLADYQSLFHSVLLNSIVGNLGDYHGVRFTVGGTSADPDGTHVETTIYRPGEAPTPVEWVISDHGGPKVIDVVAEGTSLRQTQRGDYTSYLTRHNGDFAALLAALHRQIDRAQAG